MEGEGVVRRCHDCHRDVVNLSALDEATAKALLAEQTSGACVRYRQERGRIVFARKVGRLAVAAATVALLGGTAAQADTSTPGPPAPSGTPAPRRHKRGDDKKPKPPAPKKGTPDDSDQMGLLKPEF